MAATNGTAGKSERLRPSALECSDIGSSPSMAWSLGRAADPSAHVGCCARRRGRRVEHGVQVISANAPRHGEPQL
jgi:hypothetical protein